MRPRHLAWIALALWVGAAVLLIPLAGKAGSVESTDPSLELPRQAEATRAMLQERQSFPGADTPVAVVVYTRDSGITGQTSMTGMHVRFPGLPEERQSLGSCVGGALRMYWGPPPVRISPKTPRGPRKR